MNTKIFIRRFFTLTLAAFMLCLLIGCGGEGQVPAQTTQSTTVPTQQQTTPTEAKREVTAVGEGLRHLTYNIAGSNTLERIPNFDLNEKKREHMKALITELDPDTFGIQEAPKAWIEGMVTLLEGRYAMVGGFSDEIGANEKFWYNPIYYKVDTFELLDGGVLFLEENFVHNKNSRNCAYALLQRIDDGELLLVVSTHLEHRMLGTEDVATYNYQNYLEKCDDRNLLRDEQVGYLCKLIEQKRAQYAQQYGKEISVLASGDFNINAWQDESYTHEYTRLVESMGGVKMYDTCKEAAAVQTNQTAAKWKTYREYFSTDSASARLDYIFASDNIVVDGFTVQVNDLELGDSSDHFPVYTDYHIGH